MDEALKVYGTFKQINGAVVVRAAVGGSYKAPARHFLVPAAECRIGMLIDPNRHQECDDSGALFAAPSASGAAASSQNMITPAQAALPWAEVFRRLGASTRSRGRVA